MMARRGAEGHLEVYEGEGGGGRGIQARGDELALFLGH